MSVNWCALIAPTERVAGSEEALTGSSSPRTPRPTVTPTATYISCGPRAGRGGGGAVVVRILRGGVRGRTRKNPKAEVVPGMQYRVALDVPNDGHNNLKNRQHIKIGVKATCI